ncbi:MAG: Hpt domain-containing protein [Oscillospiraceae bacterium]
MNKIYDKIYDKLFNWQCDVNGARERFLNDDELFLECLNSVSNDDLFEKLYNSLKEKNVSSAFECSHTLKGVLGNMGITPMFKQVTIIVDAVRKDNNGKEPTPDFDDLLIQFDKLKSQNEKLKEILKEQPRKNS